MHYTRETELRHLLPNDVYKLGVILDVNNCWKKLMEVIPKELNAQACSPVGALDWDKATAAAGLKYNNDHMRLIENAIQRTGESRLFSQILFDEWGTSGRRHERPTVGVLLQLLVQAELFRAADFVAINFLNEPPPPRPMNGPAARIDISFSDDIFNDIEDYVNDSSSIPGTKALNDNAHFAISVVDNNKDYYSKFQQLDKLVAVDMMDSENVPKPPPRTLRAARLQLQQQLHQQLTEQASAEGASTAPHFVGALQGISMTQSQNIPKLSALNLTTSSTGHETTLSEELDITGSSTQHTQSTLLSDAPIPLISMLADDEAGDARFCHSADGVVDANHSAMTDTEILPVISALNLKGERDRQSPCIQLARNVNSGRDSSEDSHSRSSSISNDSTDEDMELPEIAALRQAEEKHRDDVEEDDEENSLPNLSIFEQHNSNNDSSLTTVTGTSGENSFELSMNDCSSTSNDNENIPCLSALKQ